MVRETWLTDSIEKQEPQPLEAYDLVSDLSVAGKGIPWDKQDPGEEAIESLSAEVHNLLFHIAFKRKRKTYGAPFNLCNLVHGNSSSFMGREGSIKTPNCRNKVERYLRRMAYCTTVPSLFVIKGED